MFSIDAYVPRQIRPLWASASISLIGDSLHDIAILWLIYDLTGSSTATGLLGVARYLPSVVLGIFAGAWVDRVSRKSVMLWADALRAVLVGIIAALVAAQNITPLSLYFLAFAIAICTVFFNPARDAIVPQIVPPEQLMRATSVLQSSLGLAYFVGPLAAAFFLPLIGLPGLFAADSATYLLSFALILLIRPVQFSGTKQTSTSKQMAREGLQHVRRSPLIHGLLWVTAVDNLFIMGLAIVGAPIYVRVHLGLGADAYAVLQACFALGILTGSLLMIRFGSRLPRGKTLLWALVFDGVTFVPFYFTTELWTTAIGWFIHSIGIPFILTPRTSLVQSEVPQEFQGRVFSLVQLTVVGLTAVSSGMAGVLLELLSPAQLYLIMGTAAGVVGALGFLNRELRERV
ncbi:MAG: MFS transporter [Calditrichaeota bacterium]|nr:MFS transporter [Calditrichota bacterium]MCB9366761.1 MFS transporter [Calditrichota bacterium]MCB9391914.1 MFS transporter [Calditrichota bacterium]